MYCSLDLETYSEIDLKKVGVYACAAHPSTDVLCASYSIDDGPVRRWVPGDPFPLSGVDRVFAFNSQFERILWRHVLTPRYGWPLLLLEAFVCTAALCRLNALPGNLDDAARMLDTKVKKDRAGHLHMLKMCRPDPTGPHRAHHTAIALQRLSEYCDLDVYAEMQIRAKLPPIDPIDLENFHYNEHINDHGLIVDHQFAEIAVTFAAEEKALFDASVSELTGGAATKVTQKQRIKTWMGKNLSPEAWAHCHEYVDGVKKPKLDVNARERVLAAAADNPDLLTPDQTELFELLDASSKAAVAKYQAMLDRSTGGDVRRVRGAYVFAGGQQTKRAASRGLQVHNFVRHVPKEAAAIMKAVHEGGGEKLRGHVEDGRPVHAIHMLARLVRPAITGCPYGDFDLVWGDFSQIEARVLPWLADDPRAADRLEVFASGQDIYEFSAAGAGLAQYELVDGERRITKESRQLGKVLDLAGQYGGAAGSVANMARVYRVSISKAKATELVERWRRANLWAVMFWDKLMCAAFAAVRNPGHVFDAGRVSFVYDRDRLGGIGALLMRLPSGSELTYPGARIEMVTTSWGERTVGLTAMKASWKPAQGETEWPRVQIWRGLLANNATQSVGTYDILFDAIAAAREAGMTVAGDTHDEIILESAAPEVDAKRLKTIMETPPVWAAGLPLAAKVHHGYRYSIE